MTMAFSLSLWYTYPVALGFTHFPGHTEWQQLLGFPVDCSASPSFLETPSCSSDTGTSGLIGDMGLLLLNGPFKSPRFRGCPTGMSTINRRFLHFGGSRSLNNWQPNKKHGPSRDKS
ncbi:hypothetical protein LX32DRAFT_203255 [Colletotrichum zoysiae]|uniref:Secreted protein n=1 Tax=Colletotrichum zoysiae TaxID=1216348 RepID=A0AAD9H4D9_9PEZI|nr:hypothetical protein LX32DRAFT_203255 [Colletotrichum zoysiae]